MSNWQLRPLKHLSHFFVSGHCLSARNVSVASLLLHLHLWITLWRKQAMVCFFINEIHKVGVFPSVLL